MTESILASVFFMFVAFGYFLDRKLDRIIELLEHERR